MSDLRSRFEGGTDPQMQRFSSSLPEDLRFWREDIEGSKIHAQGLADAGLLTDAELQTILEGLDQVAGQLETGAFVPSPADFDDIHMAVEARLTEVIGPLGGKLHTARSRNDQVALDLRLWLKRELAALDGEVSALVDALLERIEDEGRVLMPGYTHLQRGQPILLGHHLLAHAWPLARDRRRLREALEALDFCPLGAGALAGSPHRVDRRASARRGGFRAPVPNAMDAVAARDHVQQTVAACAVLMSHLSRMAAEMVLWSSTEFGFLRLGDAYTTGSSIMPQKRNPDAAELIRGKAARVFGDLQALLTLTHGLPLSYFRDLQEDRHALFDALGTSRQCVRIMEGMWRTSRFVAERFEKELAGDFSLATELADYLVTRGVPFREAHGCVARLVKDLEEEGADLSALDPARARQYHPALGADLSEWLDPRAAAERRCHAGGTAWSQVEQQLVRLRQELHPPRGGEEASGTGC
ncbi:MAG: argininosuccinate lyase [Acidobacteriota bacterium]|nr:argininosuccinate lyase [Acidobacteriota bacterium]